MAVAIFSFSAWLISKLFSHTHKLLLCLWLEPSNHLDDKKHFSTILADSAVGPNELEVFIEDLVAGHSSQLELAWTPFNFPVVYHVIIFQPFSILFKLSLNIAAMIGNIILVWMLISFQTWWSSYIDHCLMSSSVTEIDKENMTCHKYLIILLSYEVIW